MGQVHKRFSDRQVGFPLQAYCQGLMTRVEPQEVLVISESRFFCLWREYYCGTGAFTVRYRRPTSMGISPEAEAAIEHETRSEGNDPQMSRSLPESTIQGIRFQHTSLSFSLHPVRMSSFSLAHSHKKAPAPVEWQNGPLPVPGATRLQSPLLK
jgi:hypothetical protein